MRLCPRLVVVVVDCIVLWTLHCGWLVHSFTLPKTQQTRWTANQRRPCFSLGPTTRPRRMRIAASPEKDTMPDKEETANVIQQDAQAIRNSNFDIGTALFCAGLAFDSYVESPANSSRWEKGVS